MKPSSIPSVLLIFISVTTLAQSKINGKVTSSDGAPVPYVNVLLLNPTDTSLVKGAVANEHGRYEIDRLSKGSYLLRYTAVGFETHTSGVFELTGNSEAKTLADIIMSEGRQQLSEVTVQGQRALYQQEADRTVVNIQNSVLTKGSTALQALERSPGVFIDRQNNNISLNGKSGVMVMFNGKLMRLSTEQLISMLNGMSANDIDKIELLTTPPAKYDAEGTGGMINIVSKKSEGVGTKGSVSLTGGYGTGEKAVSSVNLTHSGEKVSVYGSYTYSRDRSTARGNGMAFERPPVLGALNGYFLNKTKNLTNSHNATVGIDVRLTPKTTIGGSVTKNYSKLSNEVARHQEYHILPDSFLLMDAKIASPNRWDNVITNLYFEKKLRDGEKINIDLDYLDFYNLFQTEVWSTYFDRENNEVVIDQDMFSSRVRGEGSTPIRIGVAKMDYTTPLSRTVTLETGVKGTYTYSTTASDIENLVDDEWHTIERTQNSIDMTEDIGAVYASVNSQLSPSINMIAGLRYEYSHTKLDAEQEKNRVDRTISKLFPSLFLTKKLNDNSNLQLSFTKRISRPSYNDMASFVSWRGPYTVMSGNTSLKPTITTNIKAAYNYKEYSFSILASRDNNLIAPYQVVESEDGELIYIVPQNLKFQNTLNFQFDIPLQVNRWWNITQGFVGGWRKFRVEHTKTPVEKTLFIYSVYGSQRFKLPRNFSLEISGWYHSLRYEGSVKLEGFGMVSGGIKKELNNNHGTFQLAFDDIFRTLQFNRYYGKLAEEAFSLNSYSQFKVESSLAQIVKLTYIKSFGNTKVKEVSQRGGGARDERGRIRQN